MHVTTAEFIRNYGRLADIALREAVTITKNGHDRLVMIAAAEYARLQGDKHTTTAADDKTAPVPIIDETPDEQVRLAQMRESAVVSRPPDMSVEERLRLWHEWTHKKRPYSPPLSDEAISRASLYPDR